MLAALETKSYQTLILQQNRSLKLQLDDMKKKYEVTEKKLQEQTFSTDILKDDTCCQHYTGLPNYSRMSIFLYFLDVGEDGGNLRMRESCKKGGKGR